jgi:phosphoribosyl-ATP pyrophosphohydrolase
MTDSLDRLYAAVLAARHGDPATSRTARLWRAGREKTAKKLAEEAVEVVIDAMHGNTDAVIKESADLMYNLVVLWVAAGIDPNDVWAEMDRREQLMGIAEKLPKRLLGKPLSDKQPVDEHLVETPQSRRQVVALESRRLPKRR